MTTDAADSSWVNDISSVFPIVRRSDVREAWLPMGFLASCFPDGSHAAISLRLLPLRQTDTREEPVCQVVGPDCYF